MKPPATYQGGKARLAKPIVDYLMTGGRGLYADLCCGSGAISVELVRRGVSPSAISMLDSGPWGLFWRDVGAGKFPVDDLRDLVRGAPEREKIQAWVQELVDSPVPERPSAVFVLIQAAALGGKPVWAERGRWRTSGLRGYWTPTETSSRRYPVNPMMPMPETVLKRTETLCERMLGIIGLHADIRSFDFPPGNNIYIDPPYEGTTGYTTARAFDPVEEAVRLGGSWVSEARALTKDAVRLSGGRAKGGITGGRKTQAEEWLSWVV